MYKLAKPFFLICESSLHAGSGNDLGVVDLPIQRERHTDFPKVESSSLKGSIRDAFESHNILDNDNRYVVNKNKKEANSLLGVFPDMVNNWKIEKKDKKEIQLNKYNQAIDLTFGPEEGNAHAGALGFTDARLLLFPIKSMKGVFAWVTCPLVLERFKNDMLLAGVHDIPELPKEKTVSAESKLLVNNNMVILEEYAIKVDKDDLVDHFAKWLAEQVFPQITEYDFLREKLKTNLVVLEDNDYRDFVNLSTEVITRTKINNVTGTVQSGALFTEEYLPADSVLYSLALISPIFNTDKGVFLKEGKTEEELIAELFAKGLPQIIQLGGNATLGKGIIRTKI